MTHTQGKWIIGTDSDRNYYITAKIKADELDMLGAPVECRIVDIFYSKEAEANARLIAAAPELLEALKTCSNALASLGGKAGEYEVKKAKQAIAKAEGGKV